MSSEVLDVQTTYEKYCSSVGYSGIATEILDDSLTPSQDHFLLELRRNLPDIDSVYFVGDAPVVFFKLLEEYDSEEIKRIHRLVWNQGLVPMLCLVSPGEIRIYNCFEQPVKPGLFNDIDDETRLLTVFSFAENAVDDINEFSRLQLETGAFWNGKYGQRFRNDTRVDTLLLKNLKLTRDKLRIMGLPYDVIHDLLGRCIFLLYLEDRGAVVEEYYSRFVQGSRTLFDIIQNKEAAYQLFDAVGDKFNGDMFPVSSFERDQVNDRHLNEIWKFFLGAEMVSGQMRLWRPYDFKVIPIEFVSAIYERFLHKQEGKNYVSTTGAYYTPHALVEFIMNEVLPWPSLTDSEYKKTVLDPACGSGIFLVEAYRRLVARWMFSHKTTTVDPIVLRDILVRGIYGVDVNPDAIRVAAFSLYLTLLDYLEPKTIWESVQFPHLIHRLGTPESKGKNLFPVSAFSINDYLGDMRFDLVVGNPPWKRNGLPADISEYCTKEGFAQESAQAFLWRVRDFVRPEDGRIAMVATSKVLFNTESNDKHFRRLLFAKNYVEIIINFSALRKAGGSRGEQLFASAVGPAAVFFYRLRPLIKARPSVLYCTPKQTRVDDLLPGVVIDASEFKFLPREKCTTQDFIWKVAMWGTQRDLEIIERATSQSTIGDIFKREGWFCGRGLQRPGDGTQQDARLIGLPIIETEQVTRYWLESSNLSRLEEEYYYRTGAVETYFAPHILFKRGLQGKRLCATFLGSDCAFNDSVIGISTRKASPVLLKALTAFLNSSFATYFLFMTASMWGVERDRFNKTELLALPGSVIEGNSAIQEELALKLDELQAVLMKGHSNDIARLEQNIDSLVYEVLGLSPSAQMVVQDTLRFGLGLFQDGRASEACAQVTQKDLAAFAAGFCSEVNKVLQFGPTTAWATVYGGETPLRVVAVHFNSKQPKGEVIEVNIPDELVSLFTRLNDKLTQERSPSVFVRRNLKIFDDDTVYIVKQEEKRLWSSSMALRDVDDIIATGVSSAIAR